MVCGVLCEVLAAVVIVETGGTVVWLLQERERVSPDRLF